MTYYLKYRPKNLDELDSVSVRETLKKVLSSKNIPHAFLFSGPKGTGKTSAARIVAKIINCEKVNKGEPCNKCDQCVSISKGQNIDVIELDAASHRGIDDVRTLRDAIKLSPARAKKKVYIIDEAHMLTTEASNAFLKTLEEPPDHVLFILATTNPEKLIGTIRSRVTNVVFKKATVDEVVRSLNKIVKGEKLNVDKSALEVIARVSDGSFRDAAKTLEQLVMENKKVTKEIAEEYLLKLKSFDSTILLEYLSEKDVKKALTYVSDSIEKGVLSKNIIENLIERARVMLMAEVGLGETKSKLFSKSELIQLIKVLNEAQVMNKTTAIEQLPLEIAIIEWCEGGENIESDKGSSGSKESGGEHNNENEVKTDQESKKYKNGSKSNGKVQIGKDNSEVENANNESIELADGKNGLGIEVWKRILSQIRPKNSSTEALLRASKPIKLDGDTLRLGVYYRFHKEKLETLPHRLILEETASTILGSKVKVVCALTNPPAKKIDSGSEKKNGDYKKSDENGSANTILTETEDDDMIKVAKEIFGS